MTVSFVSIVHFGWSICLGKLEVGNPSRDIISLSEINSTGVFNLEHIWHILFSISTMLKNYFMYVDTLLILFKPFKIIWHISWLIKGFCDTILWSNPSNFEESFWNFFLILVTEKNTSLFTIFLPSINFPQKKCWITCSIIIFCK